MIFKQHYSHRVRGLWAHPSCKQSMQRGEHGGPHNSHCPAQLCTEQTGEENATRKHTTVHGHNTAPSTLHGTGVRGALEMGCAASGPSPPETTRHARGGDHQARSATASFHHPTTPPIQQPRRWCEGATRDRAGTPILIRGGRGERGPLGGLFATPPSQTGTPTRRPLRRCGSLHVPP